MTRFIVRTAILVASVILVLQPTPQAGALVGVTSSVTAGNLLVTGTAAGETIGVDCYSSNVLINGSDPDTGAATCASILTIKVNAGAGADTVHLYTDGAGWPALTSVVVNGQGGNDKVDGGDTGDTIKGGRGRDTLRGDEGNDTINGGPGRDTCSGGAGHDSISNCE